MLEEHQHTIEACRFCWMCRHICPAGLATHLETTTPRGWALQLWYVQNGLLQLDGRTVDSLYHCLQCGSCEAWCTPGFAPHRVIRDARAESVRLGTEIRAVDEAYEHFRTHGTAYGAPESRPPGRPVKAPVLYIQGCAGACLEPSHQRRVLSLFDRAGVTVALPEQSHCCGGLAYELGLDDMARELAHRTVDDIRRAGAREVVVAGDTCRRMMGELYPKWDADLAGVEIEGPARFLLKLLRAGRLSLRRPPRTRRIALQDPVRPVSPGEYDELRDVLSAIPGVEIVDMPHNQREFAQSCGEGGGVHLTHREVSAAQAVRQLEAAKAVGAQALVTSNPLCLHVLRDAAHQVSGVEVLDLTELVEQAASDEPS